MMVLAGTDDAKDNLFKARWMPTERDAVIRNLPLEVYGLNDCVSSKAIELCHNLASTLEIKMFEPNNMQVSSQGMKQKGGYRQGCIYGN